MANPTDNHLPACVVILAGGLGRRMGGNKALSPLLGSSLIGNVIDRILPQTDDIRINGRGRWRRSRLECPVRSGFPERQHTSRLSGDRGGGRTRARPVAPVMPARDGRSRHRTAQKPG